MEHYELIRRKVIIEGKSQRDAAKELGHSRKTIAKALELRIPPGYRLSEPRPRPVIEPVRHIIDSWLEQNRHARPKQRQTGQRIYERLLMRKELEYRYNEDGTMRYIKILMLFTEYPEVQVKAAVSLCVQRRAFNEDAVLNVLGNEPLPQRAKLDLSDRPELASQGNGTRDIRIYDKLKTREAVLV